MTLLARLLDMFICLPACAHSGFKWMVHLFFIEEPRLGWGQSWNCSPDKRHLQITLHRLTAAWTDLHVFQRLKDLLLNLLFNTQNRSLLHPSSSVSFSSFSSTLDPLLRCFPHPSHPHRWYHHRRSSNHHRSSAAPASDRTRQGWNH